MSGAVAGMLDPDPGLTGSQSLYLSKSGTCVYSATKALFNGDGIKQSRDYEAGDLHFLPSEVYRPPFCFASI